MVTGLAKNRKKPRRFLLECTASFRKYSTNSPTGFQFLVSVFCFFLLLHLPNTCVWVVLFLIRTCRNSRLVSRPLPYCGKTHQYTICLTTVIQYREFLYQALPWTSVLIDTEVVKKITRLKRTSECSGLGFGGVLSAE